MHLMYLMQDGKRIYILLVTKNIVSMYANDSGEAKGHAGHAEHD